MAVISFDFSRTAIWPEDETRLHGESLHHRQGILAIGGRAEGLPQHFAVDGDHIVQITRRTLHQPLHRWLERGRIKGVEQVRKGIVARNTMLQAHETAQKSLFLASEQRHVATSLAATQRREKPDHQHFVQIMPHRIASAWLFNTIEYMRKFFHHPILPPRPQRTS